MEGLLSKFYMSYLKEYSRFPWLQSKAPGYLSQKKNMTIYSLIIQRQIQWSTNLEQQKYQQILEFCFTWKVENLNLFAKILTQSLNVCKQPPPPNVAITLILVCFVLILK